MPATPLPEITERPAALGALLEALNGALNGVVTLQAEFRDWARPPRSLSMTLERRPGVPDGQPHTLRWMGGGPFPRVVQTSRRIWLHAPGRLRVEVVRDGEVVCVAVRNGTRWWRSARASSPDTGDLASADGGRLPPVLDPALLTPARLLGWLRLQPTGTASQVGREVITARAAPRDEFAATSKGLLCELAFDAQHGVMLRMATYRAGWCVERTEAMAIAYDLSLEPALFTWPGTQT